MYFGKFHKALQEQARYFAQKELTDELLIQTEKTGIFPKDVIHKMARAGFLGIKTPKVYGEMCIRDRWADDVRDEILLFLSKRA